MPENGNNQSSALGESIFRDLFENAPLCVFQEDLGQSPPRIVRANRRAVETYGWSEEEFTHLSVKDLIPPHLRNEMPGAAEALRAGRPYFAELHNLRKDGTSFPVRVSAARFADHPGQVVVMVEDITAEVEARQARQERDRTALALLNASTERAVLMDLEGRIIELNDTAAAALGDSVEELRGRRLREFFSPELIESRRVKFLQAIETGRPVRFQDVRQGRTLDNHIYPIADAEGNVTRLAGFSRDITDLKQAEESARQSEARFRDIAEIAADCVWEIDEDRRYTFWSERIQDLLGYAPEDVLGLTPFELMPPEEAERVRPLFERIAARKEPFRNLENWLVSRGGERVCVLTNGTPILDAEGRLRGYRGVDTDITPRKRAIEEAQAARQRLQKIVDNSWDTIFQMDLEGNYTFANPAAERLTGYWLEELLQMNMRELLAPEHLDGVLRRLRARIAGRDLEQPYSFDFIHKDGHRVTVELTTTGVYQNGDLVGIQGIARDISEIRRAERAAREAHRKLMSAREEERRRLASDLHDSIGQALVALRMSLQTARDACREAPTSPAQREMRRASEMTNSLIPEVRAICQGLFPPTLASLGLAPALRELCARHSNDTLDCLLEVDPSLEESRLPAEVETALFRIAQEAVANAIRHGEATTVTVGLRFIEGEVVLTVTNDGDPFDPNAARDRGMGINSMQERARAIGGELTLESTEGETRITARAPLPHPPGSG